MRTPILLLLFLLVCAITPGVNGMADQIGGNRDIDLFSSMDELRKLFGKEREVHRRLKEYLEHTDRQIEALDKLLDEHYQNYDFDEASAAEYVSNPINTYVLLKRTGLHWPRTKKAVFDSESSDPADNSNITAIEKDLGTLPTQEDLQGAAAGIFLLHETYNLNLKRLAEGELEVPGSGGKEFIPSASKLDSQDLEILGKLAFNRGFYDRATEWLEAAIWKAEEVEKTRSEEYIKILKSTLATMKAKHDKVLVQKGPRGENWKTFRVPFDQKLAKKKKYKKIKDKRYTADPVSNSTDNHYDVTLVGDDRLWDLFNAACRGEPGLRPPELDAGLGCHFQHYGDPYLRLGPFKLEAKNKAPFVAVFRDFMYEAETESYREAAASHLHRSRHFGKGETSNHASVKRTSSQTWLAEEEGMTKTTSAHSEAVTKRIELATRLYARSYRGGEPYQVANYGIGGVYNHHTDSSGEFGRNPADGVGSDGDMVMGDRLATSMVYLTDVAAGGATAYPMLGLAVFPRRGDMVFWYNNDRNGRLDRYTFHGGCPVLVGSKWITNKWIHSLDQHRYFPCLVDKSAFFRLKPMTNDLCRVTEQCDKTWTFTNSPKIDFQKVMEEMRKMNKHLPEDL